MLFTTHSLAMMRTLSTRELIFLEDHDGHVTPIPASYAFINSVLFGFKECDRYILVEDVVTRDFVMAFIQERKIDAFLTYKVIHIGGGSQVCDLIDRNRREHILAMGGAVIAVLDGDQRSRVRTDDPDVLCLPFDDVEKTLHRDYQAGNCPYRLADGKGFNGDKDLFNSLIRDGVATRNQLFSRVTALHADELDSLEATLTAFLGRG